MSLNDHIKAILFDLDGTLINVDLHEFRSSYLKLLASKISHLIKPYRVISNLLITSEAVVDNDGSKTNEQIFKDTFFPLIGYSQEEIFPYIDKFYEEDFPKLKKYTSLNPDARKVLEKAFEKDYDVVIATTPVLPEVAIKQRLEWAGVGDFPYKLITTLENSRACKPNLLYYELILKDIDQSAEKCLMVGDEDRDMIASLLGLKTYFIKSPWSKLGKEIPKPNYSGTLNDLEKLL